MNNPRTRTVQKLFSPSLRVLLAASLLGTSGLFIKAIETSPVYITLIRTAVPTLFFLLLFALRRHPILRRITLPVVLGSLLNALRLGLFFLGFKLTSMGNVVVIFYSWPLFAYLLSIPLFGETLTRRRTGLLLLAFAGIITVYSSSPFAFSSTDFLGMSAVLLSALLPSLSILSFKTAAGTYTKLEITFFQNFLSTLLYLPALLFRRPLPTVSDTLTAAAFGAVIGILAFTLFSSLHALPASRAAHLSYMEVISALILATLVLGDPPTPNLLIGGTLILSSLYFLERRPRAA